MSAYINILLDKKTILLSGAGVICGSILGYKIYIYRKLKAYSIGCRNVCKERDDKILKLEARLKKMDLQGSRVDEITTLSLTQLVRRLKSGELTAVETLAAYQTSAIKAHKDTNCLTNVIEEADKWAKELDDRYRRSEPTGLLHGVPISVKDNIPVAGYPNSRGCLIFKDVVAEQDALLIQALRAEGAIPFVKTNIPQLALGIESDNALYGAVVNPHDKTRTPGGSSGGEGALIAAGGSVLGIGTDVGGSIRIPSAFCGIVGLKPTSSRLSLRGDVPFGQQIVRSCWGPMARDVDSLALAMQAVLTTTMFDGDKTVPPMPFDESVYQSQEPLTIGYYTHDGIYPALPSMTRAVLKTKSILEARGHKLKLWKHPDMEFCLEGFYKSISGDKGCMYHGFLGTGEVIHPSIQNMIRCFAMPEAVRFFKLLWARFNGDKTTILRLSGCKGVSSVFKWFQWTTQIKLYIERYEDQWREEGLDVLICPAYYHAAPKLNWTRNTIYNGFVNVYNLLDHAAGVVPVSEVNSDDIKALETYPATDSTSRRAVQDQRDSLDLPVNVQCVAPMWHEELCLRLMKEVEQGLTEKTT